VSCSRNCSTSIMCQPFDVCQPVWWSAAAATYMGQSCIHPETLVMQRETQKCSCSCCDPSSGVGVCLAAWVMSSLQAVQAADLQQLGSYTLITKRPSMVE